MGSRRGGTSASARGRFSLDCTVGGCDTRGQVCCGIRSDMTSDDAARGAVAQAHRGGHSSQDEEMIGALCPGQATSHPARPGQTMTGFTAKPETEPRTTTRVLLNVTESIVYRTSQNRDPKAKRPSPRPEAPRSRTVTLAPTRPGPPTRRFRPRQSRPERPVTLPVPSGANTKPCLEAATNVVPR